MRAWGHGGIDGLVSTDDEAGELFVGSVSSPRDGEMSEGTKGSSSFVKDVYVCNVLEPCIYI
jgi:hypothetical protein